MDLFSTFTANAAAKHGHEFSTTPPVAPSNGAHAHPHQPNMRLPRSPLSFVPRARTLPAGRSRPRPQSMKITMAELKEDPEGESREEEHEEEELRKIEAKIRSFTIPGAFQETPPSSTRTSEEEVHAGMRVSSPSPETSGESVPVARETSGESAASSSANATESSGSKVNGRRSKVFYRLGRPVHAERKHFVRPKCLLQVQQPLGKFHRPVFDVVPGSRFAPRTKIGQKLRRLKKNKDGTGADDLVVVRSEHSQDKEDTSEEEHEKEHDHEHETLNGREVLGTIQPAEDGPSAYITLGDTVWKATLGGTGHSYFLENANDPSQRARWHMPKSKRDAAENGAGREYRFTSLEPGVKRHPYFASMSEGHLEFSESYSTLADPSNLIDVDEPLRRLIIVSGLWVYFCEGWSKHYDFSNAVATSSRPMPLRSQSTRSARNTFKDILPLRSPSRSPAPSMSRCGGSVSSDARSREGSHDSTNTSHTISPAGTMIRHFSTHCSSSQTATPTESRAQSPKLQMRGRRRWSATFTTHFRRFSHSVRQSKGRSSTIPQAPMVVNADLLGVEDLAANADLSQHPLQRAFIKPGQDPKLITVTMSGLVDDEGTSAPLNSNNLPPLPAAEPTAEKEAAIKEEEVLAKVARLREERIAAEQAALAGAQFDGTTDERPPTARSKSDAPSPPRPHRFGLGDLARPKSMFEPTHRRSASSSSSNSDTGDAGWWSQYDRMVLKRDVPVVVPTSPY